MGLSGVPERTVRPIRRMVREATSRIRIRQRYGTQSHIRRILSPRQSTPEKPKPVVGDLRLEASEIEDLKPQYGFVKEQERLHWHIGCDRQREDSGVEEISGNAAFVDVGTGSNGMRT